MITVGKKTILFVVSVLVATSLFALGYFWVKSTARKSVNQEIEIQELQKERVIRRAVEEAPKEVNDALKYLEGR